MNNGMRVAVTGAAGFLGKHLVRGLEERGFRSTPLARAALAAALAEPSLLDGHDVVVHAAAVRHRHGIDAAEYRDANVSLVERVLRACASATPRVRRLVYVSSVGVYGFPARLPITEQHPHAPVTLYSVTKVEAEQLVRRLAPELGVDFTIVRPTIIYGRGDDNGMLDKMARMIRAGSYRIVGDGQNELHHTHVDDVVEGIALACTCPAASGEDFILAGPETITLARLSALVARAVGARAAAGVPRVRVPLALARAVATVIDVARYRGIAFATKEPPLNHEKLDVMTRAIAFDSSKAQRLLGHAARVRYEEGIARTLGDPPPRAPQ